MLKFMVEFRNQPGMKNPIVDAFTLRGPNRNPGVEFKDAWLGKQDDLIFILCESDEQSLVENACRTWSEYGEFRIFPVVEIQDY
jgi:hypothetical protein